MSKGTQKNRRDENEPQILAVFNAAGAYWQPCTRMQGHDGTLYYRGNIFEIEIKNGGGKHLTQREKDFAREIGKRGVRLWVLISDVEAEWLISGDYWRIPDRTDDGVVDLGNINPRGAEPDVMP